MRRESIKYDGSLHYSIPVEVVECRPELLATYCAAGTPLTCYRGAFPAPRHYLELYWPGAWHTLEVFWEPDWTPNAHYSNVITPATWDDQAVRFVDLDLDVMQRVDEAPFIDDADEFAEHQVRWSYPPDLVARAEAEAAEVMRRFTDRLPPYDGRLHTWRPAAPLPMWLKSSVGRGERRPKLYRYLHNGGDGGKMSAWVPAATRVRYWQRVRPGPP